MQLCIYTYVYIDVYVDIYFHIALDLSEPALKPYNILEQVSIWTKSRGQLNEGLRLPFSLGKDGASFVPALPCIVHNRFDAIIDVTLLVCNHWCDPINMQMQTWHGLQQSLCGQPAHVHVHMSSWRVVEQT